MINYLRYFFNPAHLFSLRPEAMRPRALTILALAFGALIIAGLILKFGLPKIKDSLKIKGAKRLVHLCLISGILGFVYLFFAWQGVALLASRLWLLILGLTILIWLFFIGKYFFLTAPKTRQDLDRKKKFNQYIP